MTILELARIGYKFGLDPPNLIRMEKEIEKEEEVVEVKPEKPTGLDAEVIPVATTENVFDLDAEVRVSLTADLVLVFGCGAKGEREIPM
jgi:hypothetical protein